MLLLPVPPLSLILAAVPWIVAGYIVQLRVAADDVIILFAGEVSDFKQSYPLRGPLDRATPTPLLCVELPNGKHAIVLPPGTESTDRTCMTLSEATGIIAAEPLLSVAWTHTALGRPYSYQARLPDRVQFWKFLNCFQWEVPAMVPEDFFEEYAEELAEIQDDFEITMRNGVLAGRVTRRNAWRTIRYFLIMILHYFIILGVYSIAEDMAGTSPHDR